MPTKKTDYIDNTLIKLVRQYSKDETIAALSKKLAEVEIEKGQALSYIQELEDLYNQMQKGYVVLVEKYNKTKQRLNDLDIEARKNDLIKSAEAAKAELRKQLKRLRENNAELVNKICVLENQIK